MLIKYFIIYECLRNRHIRYSIHLGSKSNCEAIYDALHSFLYYIFFLHHDCITFTLLSLPIYTSKY